MSDKLKMKQKLCCIIVLIKILSGKLCNVFDFGATGDGITDDTLSIQKALDECTNHDTETSIIYFPSSYIFYTYPLRLNKNNVNIWIDTNSTLYVSPNFNGSNSKWTYNEHRYINFLQNSKNLNNITLYGNGLINGNGFVWYNALNGSERVGNRPYLIFLENINNLLIYNLTFLNSPSYNIALLLCNNITIYNINITSPPWNIAPNTDGIDIASSNVHIYNSYIKNGDDSYCLKEGAKNVLIENSSAEQAFCFSSGSGAAPYNIYNCTFRNLLCKNAESGLKVKGRSDQSGTMSNILFENIELINVAKGISVDNEIGNGNKSIIFHDIMFNNIYGTYTQSVGNIQCTNNTCYNLLFQDIDLQTDNKNASNKWICSTNVYGKAVNVTPPLTCLNSTH